MSGDDLTAGVGGAGARRAPRQGVGGAPVGSMLSIVLAIIALVLGYLILQDLREDAEVATGAPGDALPAVDTEAPVDSFEIEPVDTEVTTTTTTIPFFTQGATVVVANGNNVGGSAGRMTEALRTADFIMGDPTNASSTVDASIVYYNPTVTAAQDVAGSVALALGGVDVLPLPTPAPVSSGSIGDTGVLLVLGNDEVDRPLETPGSSATLGTPDLGETPVAPDE